MKKMVVYIALVALPLATLAAQSQPRLIVGVFSGGNENDVNTVRSIAERQIAGAKKFRVLSNADYLRMGSPDPAAASGQELLRRERIDYVLRGAVNSTYTGYEITFSIYGNTGAAAASAADFTGGSSQEMYAGISAMVNQLIAQMIAKNLLAYAVGDRGPAGGWIFYDKGAYSDGWRYLEAAPKEGEIEVIGGWDSRSTWNLNGAVGSGKENQQKILAWQRNNPNERSSAATIAARCEQLRAGGYSGWFIPSYTELALMKESLDDKGLGEFGWRYYCCTGTENTSLSFNGENYKPRVRPARQF